MFESSGIRGFNYIPSYALTDMWWSDFRGEIIEAELARGKRYFPGFNTVRVFLGYNAYLANPSLFRDNFDRFLAISSKLKIAVAPVLFNRWHSGLPDFGGIYLDHFLPGQSYVQFELVARGDDHRAAIGFDKQFAPYIRDVVGAHREDDRIIFWDLCNEPFFGPAVSEDETVARAEYRWLELVNSDVRKADPVAPITIGTHSLHGVEGVFRLADLSDFISTHPYVDNVWMPDRAEYSAFLDSLVARAGELGKQLLASETVWGSSDDDRRQNTLEFTLNELEQRGIGYLAFGLNHSLASDSHREEYGSVGSAGSCAFIEADGSLRPGHERFNRERVR